MMKPALVLLLTTLLAVAASARELRKDETAALLDRLRQDRAKHPALRADFTERKSSPLVREPIVSAGTVAFQPPDKFRREVRGANSSVTVSDGRTLRIHYPGFNAVEVYPLGKRTPFDESIAALTAGLNLHGIEEFYSIRAFEEKDGFRFDLAPRRSSLKRMLKSLTIRTAPDLNIRRTEAVLARDGKLETTYSNHQRKPLPASTFEFTPPPGATVTHPLGR